MLQAEALPGPQSLRAGRLIFVNRGAGVVAMMPVLAMEGR
jgi:hypothetical protein